MIAFDTNVLLRLLVKDDPDQYAAAVSLLERAADDGEPCYLSDVVLCETSWVLATRYGARRADILAAISQIAADPRYALDDPEAVHEALRAFEVGKAEFSDYLIGARARSRGARVTYTHDRKLKNQGGYRLLKP